MTDMIDKYNKAFWRAENLTDEVARLIAERDEAYDLLDRWQGHYRNEADRAYAAEAKVAVLESLRPVWAQGWTDDGVAAQVSGAALASIWELLGVSNQTDAMQKLERLIAERDEARRHVEELQAKLDPEHSCACSYDHAGAVCGHHSPMLAAAEAEVARLRGLLRSIEAWCNKHGKEPDWLDRVEAALAEDNRT